MTHLKTADALKIGRLDAHDQATLLRSGEISAEELIETAIIRIEKLDPMLNAISYRAFDEARAKAKSLPRDKAFAGVPYLVKDSLLYPGMPSRAGSRSRGEERAVSAYPYIERFDAEGLIPVGKSTMPEFGLLPSNEPLRYGPTLNPWALDRSTAGSSGGAAAAVASGMVPLAHASDAAGSIRLPASCCGLVGLKASRGANVRARTKNMIDDLLCSDTLMARSVRDAEWNFHITYPKAREMRPKAAKGRRLKIALVMNGLEGQIPQAEVSQAIAKTADLCSQLGHHVEIATLPIDGVRFMTDFKILWSYLASELVDHYRDRGEAGNLEHLLEPWTIQLAEWGKEFGGTDLARLYETAIGSGHALRIFFQSYDLVLSPTMTEVPPKIGEYGPTRSFPGLLQGVFDYIPYTPLQNLIGTPAISLPLFTSSGGLPIGSMFSADMDREDLLFDLAYELEDALPWGRRWPDCVTRLLEAA